MEEEVFESWNRAELTLETLSLVAGLMKNGTVHNDRHSHYTMLSEFKTHNASTKGKKET